MAAPKFNLNAIRNGTRLVRLTVGELPTKLQSVKREGRRYRVCLEDAVTEAHGEVSVMAAHNIDTATQGMIHAGICRWLLRDRIEKMSASDILATSREMLKAKETRDRSVKALGLDRDDRNIIDALYSSPDTAERSSNEPATSKASEKPPTTTRLDGNRCQSVRKRWLGIEPDRIAVVEGPFCYSRSIVADRP